MIFEALLSLLKNTCLGTTQACWGLCCFGWDPCCSGWGLGWSYLKAELMLQLPWVQTTDAAAVQHAAQLDALLEEQLTDACLVSEDLAVALLCHLGCLPVLGAAAESDLMKRKGMIAGLAGQMSRVGRVVLAVRSCVCAAYRCLIARRASCCAPGCLVCVSRGLSAVLDSLLSLDI